MHVIVYSRNKSQITLSTVVVSYRFELIQTSVVSTVSKTETRCAGGGGGGERGFKVCVCVGGGGGELP